MTKICKKKSLNRNKPLDKFIFYVIYNFMSEYCTNPLDFDYHRTLQTSEIIVQIAHQYRSLLYFYYTLMRFSHGDGLKMSKA